MNRSLLSKQRQWLKSKAPAAPNSSVAPAEGHGPTTTSPATGLADIPRVPETYTYVKSCFHAEYGLTSTGSKDLECGGSGCTYSFLNGRCGAAAIAKANTALGDRSIIAETHSLSNFTQEGDGRRTAYCEYTLSHAGDSQHAQICGTGTGTRDGVCRTPALGLAPASECGTSTELQSSGAGLFKAQIQDGDADADLDTAQCSTFESVAVGAQRLIDSVARSSATDAFWSTLPASAAEEQAARADLVKQAKLMFELGIGSPAVNLDAVRTLYATSPDQAFGCGVSARAPVSDGCRTWGAGNRIDGALGLCQRMLSSHVAPAVFTTEMDRCLDLLQRPELRENNDCAREYRGVALGLSERLLDKALTEVQKPDASAAILGVDSALRRIDRWYAGAALVSAARPQDLSDATGRVLLAFWNRVYLVGSPAVSFPGGEAGSTAAAQQLAALFSQRLETDRQVLAAAFASPAPLDEPPLLLLTADALSSLHERLRTSAPLYDFACRIKSSCPESDANEATNLLRLIGAIGNDVALGQALAASVSVRTPWREVFTAIRAQRQALESAYRKASGRGDASLEELYAPNLVTAAAGLEELVASSATMWASYQSHGVLMPRDGSLLRASMAESARTGTVALFSESLSDLTLARDSYQKIRGDFANTILARINSQQYQDRIRNEAAVLGHDYDRLATDLSGLMASQDQAEWLIGRFLAAYTERARAPDWLPNYPVSGTPHTIAVNAGDGRGDGSVIRSAAQVVAAAVRDPIQTGQPWQLEVAKGDMLTFNVSGAWAPTCALRLTSILGPSGRTEFVDPINTTTGPEGYEISWDNGKFRAREHSSSSFSTTSGASTICGSINTALGSQPRPDRLDFSSAALSGSYCRSWQTGHTEADTTSNGDRFSVSASFAGGLRIPGTPLPTLPGGSLLLVEVQTVGDGEQVLDVHVVRSQSTVLFRHASKVYLVVNDTSCSTFNPSQLAVTYVHAQSAAAASQVLAQTMATVLSSLDTEKDRYVAQGSITASELSALQTSAYDRLLASCDGCNLSAYPEQVRGMFDAWLSAKLASIERQTRIASAQRDLDRLVLRANALQSDLTGAEGASRLLALMTSWQLGHLAFHQLREKSNLVLEFGNDYMLPLLYVRYPQALTVLRTYSTDVINGLRNVDWTLPFDEQLQRLEALGSAVATRVGQATLIGGQASASLIVAFPKPLPAGTTTARPSIPGAVVASPDRASAVWELCSSDSDDYCLKPNPVFTIDPADVYGQPSIGLGCGEAAPIVRALAVFAANTVTSGNEIWNSTPRRFDNVRTSDIGFATETGVRSYRVGPPLGALTGARVRSLVGTVNEAWPSFTAFARADRDFDGTSPFGSFEVNFGPFATDSTSPLSSAHTMVVVMDVETRATVGPLLGVSSCRGAQ